MEGTRMSQVLRFVFIAVLSLLVPTVHAAAENYPDRVVRMVNPYPPGGNVRPLANAGAKRPLALPNVPTVAEQGLPGFESSSWYGLVAPAKTPEPVLAKLRKDVAKVLEVPDVIARIRELGSDPGAVFGNDFAAFMAAETKKWAEVIRASGAKAD